MVLDAGSRLNVEASRDRTRVNAEVRKWALEAVMGSKKAAHAFLVGWETVNTPAMPPLWRIFVRPQSIGAVAGR